MCVIAAKYFEESGWILVKNRDRNYKPLVYFKQSKKKNIERLLLWDDKTRWTEGVNEFGIGIISAAVQVKKDEKIGTLSGNAETHQQISSNDGRKLREALFEKTVDDAINKLIELKLPGNTLVSDGNRCMLLEGDHRDNKTHFEYKTKEIQKDQTVVRTNHGILIKSGYDKNSDDKQVRDSFKSSLHRKLTVEKCIKSIKTSDDMLDCLSDTSNADPQLNPLRKSNTHGKRILVTTGQLMIVPKERTLHYRPVWCDVDLVNFDKLGSEKTKTWFEIISARKLLTFKEFCEQRMEQQMLPGFEKKRPTSNKKRMLTIVPGVTTYHYGEKPSRATWFEKKFIASDIGTDKNKILITFVINKKDLKKFDKLPQNTQEEIGKAFGTLKKWGHKPKERPIKDNERI